jgi:serine/threonine protein phosphatase PrpC
MGCCCSAAVGAQNSDEHSPRFYGSMKLLDNERVHELKATCTALSVEPLPDAAATVTHSGGTLRVHKATYDGNDPSEDRSTVVIGEDFVFCGVWDGHGGTPCSEYIETHAFEHFADGKSAGKTTEDVWRHCFSSLDADYLQQGMGPGGETEGGQDADTTQLFAGACCTGCFVDLRAGLHCSAQHFELLLDSAVGLDMKALRDQARLKKQRRKGRRASIERMTNTLTKATHFMASSTDSEEDTSYVRVKVNGSVVGRSPARAGTKPEWHTSVVLHGMSETEENTVRIEIMVEEEVGGVVELKGTGMEAFDACRRELKSFPISDDFAAMAEEGGDSESFGQLFCQVQAGVNVGVGNLGDSRAVLGKYRGGQLRTLPLSRDHSVNDSEECERLAQEHEGIAGAEKVTPLIDPKTERVKGICAFTRSIGDFQMKDQGAAEIWNSKKKVKVQPVPGSSRSAEQEENRAGEAVASAAVAEPGEEASGGGDPSKGGQEEGEGAQVVPPYISCVSEYQAEKVIDGFVIIGCDGVWDEMSSGEAVQIVSELLANQAAAAAAASSGGTSANTNVAELFIDKVLEKVVERLRATFKDEANLTLEELKQRPAGKGMHVVTDADGAEHKKYRRSCLHDDITAIILHFTSSAGRKAQVDVASGLAADKRSAGALAATEAYHALAEDSAAAAAAAARQEAMEERPELGPSDSSRLRAQTILLDDEKRGSTRKATGTATAAAADGDDSSEVKGALVRRSSSPAMVMASTGLPDMTNPITIRALARRMGLSGVSAEEAAACTATLKEASTKQSSSDHALHLRNAVAGQLETKGELESLFAQYGEVVQAVVRHREREGVNTSWALVYMADEEGCAAALAATTLNPYTQAPLEVNRFNKKTAAASKGGMVQVLQLAEFERWVKAYARQQLMRKWGGAVRLMEE